MTAKLIDGKKIAQEIHENLKEDIAALQKRSARIPGLAVVLVGDNPASIFYVNKKESTCKEIGFKSFKTVLPLSISKEELIKVIQDYNNNSEVDGILLQLPLPDHLRPYTQEIVDIIDIIKDVDGLTTENLGKLLVNPEKATWPCTPKGCIELLKRTDIDIQGKSAIVIGRSTLVGKPLAIILNSLNATVTMAHSKTVNLAQRVKEADLVFAAIGVAEFIKGEWIKPGATVIDVGINTVISDLAEKKILGDVDLYGASLNAGYITPVPGGVGPMTVAMLMKNTFELYEKRLTC